MSERDDSERFGEESPRIVVADKRRIRSADDTCDDADVADLTRAPSFVAKLEEEARLHDERLKEYIAAHKEKMAEMDALRKRLEADVENRARTRFGELVADLLPVVDDIDRAILMAHNSRSDDPLLAGVRMMRSGLMKALAARGLEEVNLVGTPFDPEAAQAVGVVPVEAEEDDQKVIEQLAPCYRFGGRVVRAALVRVGRKA
ncbi:MAG: nucleotide exchange factor GrpE [Nitrospinae bacterium]|nr:nucleotide exchange factor GrpE [Nitrospinota bacterium]